MSSNKSSKQRPRATLSQVRELEQEIERLKNRPVGPGSPHPFSALGIPFSAAILICNQYSIVKKEFRFVSQSAPKTRVVNGTGYEVWDQAGNIHLKVTENVNAVRSATVELDRLSLEWARHLSVTFALRRELDRRIDERFPETEIEKAQIEWRDASDRFRAARERFEVVKATIEGAKAVVHIIPLELLDNFIEFETDLKIATIQLAAEVVPTPDFPADLDEWLSARKVARDAGEQPKLHVPEPVGDDEADAVDFEDKELVSA